MAVLHLFVFPNSADHGGQEAEVEIQTIVVKSMLLFADSNVSGLQKANLSIGCCTISRDYGALGLVRLTRPVVGSLRTGHVEPYILAFER